MSQESQFLKGYKIPKKSMLKSVIVVPQKRPLQRPRSPSNNKKSRRGQDPGESKPRSTLDYRPRSQQCKCPCTCNKKINKTQKNKETQTEALKQPEVVVINRKRRRRCPKCQRRHAKEARCTEQVSAITNSVRQTPRQGQTLPLPAAGPSSSKDVLEDKDNQESEDEGGYMTPSNQDTYFEANNPQYVQAPSPIDSLADWNEDVILGDITEEDRRAILEEKIELDMDWLTL